MLHEQALEVRGVLFHVEYDPKLPITIHKVRTLGADYKPTGPDLTHLLHDTLLLEDGSDDEAVRFLSLITEDIHANQSRAQAAHNL